MNGSSRAKPAWVFLALVSHAACADVRDEGGFGASASATEGEASGIATNPGDGPADGPGEGTSAKFDVGDGAEGAGDDGGPLASCDAAAEDESSTGCAFWAVDLPNAWAHSIWNPPDTAVPAEQQFSVVVANASSQASAHVEVFESGTLVDSADVSLDEIHVFDLPRMDIDAQVTTTDGRAYEIVSDVPIAAYQFQPLDNDPPPYSNDASLLFPVHALGSDYVAVTGYSSGMNLASNPNVPTNIGAFVSIVATEDGTVVDTWPTAPLAGTTDKGVELARGEVFTIIADGGGAEGVANLSGTRVAASKPVAVFSGNVAAHEPVDIAGCCLDHLEHQLLPMSAWSTRYLGSAPPRYDGKTDESYVVRMVGGEDGTMLTYDPVAPVGAPVELSAGQTVEFTTKQSFAVEGTLPFSFVQFLQSNQTLGYMTAPPGDPAMWVVPPVQQYQSKYVFLSPPGYAANFVTITNPAGVEIELDGQIVSGQYYATGQVGGINYVHVHVPVAPGPHLIVAAEPIGISVFGYAKDVSYAYPGGSGVKYFQPPPPPPQG